MSTPLSPTPCEFVDGICTKVAPGHQSGEQPSLETPPRWRYGKVRYTTHYGVTVLDFDDGGSATVWRHTYQPRFLTPGTRAALDEHAQRMAVHKIISFRLNPLVLECS